MSLYSSLEISHITFYISLDLRRNPAVDILLPTSQETFVHFSEEKHLKSC